jgi:hypothetical protein
MISKNTIKVKKTEQNLTVFMNVFYVHVVNLIVLHIGGNLEIIMAQLF